MDLGVEGLDPTPEHLRRARHIGHLGVRDARLAQLGRRVAAGHQLPSQLREALGQFDQAFFVVDGQQCPHRVISRCAPSSPSPCAPLPPFAPIHPPRRAPCADCEGPVDHAREPALRSASRRPGRAVGEMSEKTGPTTIPDLDDLQPDTEARLPTAPVRLPCHRHRVETPVRQSADEAGHVRVVDRPAGATGSTRRPRRRPTPSTTPRPIILSRSVRMSSSRRMARATSPASFLGHLPLPCLM